MPHSEIIVISVVLFESLNKVSRKQIQIQMKMFISKETTDIHLSKVDFFRTARIFLRIFGIWPMDQGPLPMWFYVNFISLFVAAIFGVAYGFVNLNNLFMALESFCGSVFEFISW